MIGLTIKVDIVVHLLGRARRVQLGRGGELVHHADHPQVEPERKRKEGNAAK